MKKIVLILPTFNESENVATLIDAVQMEFKKIKGYEASILVVDDYSPDGTADIVTKIAKKEKNVSLISKKKEGLGAAIVFGVEHALRKYKPDILMQMDADWSHNPKLIPEFIKKIEKGADFVVGSRYVKGGSIPPNWGLHRKLFSIIGNLWVRLGLGMLSPHDWSSGYRAMRREVFEKVSDGLSKYSGYLFQIGFLHRVKKAGFSVDEVPLVFVDRVRGRSKFPAVEYIQSVSLYVINNSTLIKYILIGIVGFSVQTILSKVFVEFGMFEGLSVAIGSFFAIVTNFLGNNLWTFSSHKIKGLRQLLTKFIHFLGTSIGAVIIQSVVVSLGVLLTPISWFWWMVGAIIFLVIPYNYFIYNKFIWKTHKPQVKI